MRGIQQVSIVAVLLGCGERGEAQFPELVRTTADRVIPSVERAVGLSFREPPNIQIRTREQVRDYLIRKVDNELPTERLEGIQSAYRLFGLMPEDLDLRSLLIPLLEEQVVGFFDPDSGALYIPEGTPQVQLSLILVHELVHALQAQYVALDSILTPEGANDAVVAAQATMEGQATLAMVTTLIPSGNVDEVPGFWESYRTTVEQQQTQMPVFRDAPVIVRETLIFPYLQGAIFAHWFAKTYPDTVPYGPRMPVSTEQILHTERYRQRDVPIWLTFPPRDDIVYQDGLGEFEMRILLQELSGSASVGANGALGWDGDQYAVFASPSGQALVWWTVWDNDRLADRFVDLIDRLWEKRARPGRRVEVLRSTIAGQGAVRLIDAPDGWAGWRAVPEVQVTRPVESR